MVGQRTRADEGNRYHVRMVVHDVSDSEKAPGMMLVARLHVDLCRLASAMCTRHVLSGLS
jgi:hypothetical protein